MLRKTMFALILGALTACATMAEAQPANKHIIIAPSCLLEQLHYSTLARTNSFSLVQLNDVELNQLMNTKPATKNVCGRFNDITRAWNDFAAKKSSSKNMAATFLIAQLNSSISHSIVKTTYHIQYEKVVKQLLNQLNPSFMWNKLTTLTDYADRYANSETGKAAAEWLALQINEMTKAAGRNDVSIHTVDTPSYKQSSVIVKVGAGDTAGVVIGAHMDTLSKDDWFNRGNKPGADDDGSGSVTVLEAARTIISSGMHFKKPIYFIWYAAEEEGMVGSDYVVTEFKTHHIPVDAVLHFDMTGYAPHNDMTMWLMKDYVNADLTAYLETLIKTYINEPVGYSQCGYACSDHARWTQDGYAASIATETAYENMNNNLHTARDTMDKLSLNHMTDFAKLAVAFAVELAEPVDN